MASDQASSSSALIRGSDVRRTPGVSLNKQVVLEEDDYTDALSHIIKRDFFPNLSRLAATNSYLSALETQDSAGISSAIRELSAIGNVDGPSSATPRSRGHADMTERRRRDAELAEMNGTPYISRTPFGAGIEGMETPVAQSRYGPRQMNESSKRRKIDTSHGLDNFQHIYTSEDNASFIDILHDENRLRKERFSWAYEHEAKERSKRLAIEQGRRKVLMEAGEYAHVEEDGVMPRMIEVARPTHRLALGAATEGSSQEDAGHRLLGILDKGKERFVELDDNRETSSSQALIAHDTETDESGTIALPIPNALPLALAPSFDIEEDFVELMLNPSSHLAKALNLAGLPETAMVSLSGQVIPVREAASGSGDGPGRGAEEREKRERVEEAVMAETKDARSVEVPTWGFRTRNALMFGPDADVDPITAPKPLVDPSTLRQAPPEIHHANTRLPDEQDDDMGLSGRSSRNSRRASSPSRSKVAAAIGGTPYHPKSSMPTFNNYPLVPVMPSPSPSELGPQAVSDLMTWGTLLSTPRAISGPEDTDNDHPGASGFRIRDSNSRDRIGRNLATNAARAMRERARGFGTAPRGLAVLSGADVGRDTSRGSDRSMGPPSLPVGSTPRRTADGLTPAGRSLLERTAGASPLRRRGEGLGLPTSTSSSGRRSRGDAMEQMGGWGAGTGKRRIPGDRTWTPSPVPKRSGGA